MATFSLYHGDFAAMRTHYGSTNLIITSPPYNIGSGGPAKTGQRKLGKFDAKSYRGIREYPDNMKEADYQDWQVDFLYWCAATLTTGGILVYNHKPRRKAGRIIHPLEWISRCSELALVEEIVWDRGSTHNHSPHMFWNQTERLYVLRRAEDKYARFNREGLMFRGDVWRMPKAKNNGHNAPFPVELALNCIDAYLPNGGVVCDPFTGSGTVGVAAAMRGCEFVGAELMANYYKMARERIENAYDAHA